MSHDDIVLDLNFIRRLDELYMTNFSIEAPAKCYEFDLKRSAEENLEKLSIAALTDKFSLRYLFVYKRIILEVISRWISVSEKDRVVEVFDVIARYTLCYKIAIPLVEKFLERENEYLVAVLQNASSQDSEQLRMILLAYYRVLSQNKEVFVKFVSPDVLYKVVNRVENSQIARFLAAKILSIYLDAGERAEYDAISCYFGSEEPILGVYEKSKSVNYRFLELNEAKMVARFLELPGSEESSVPAPEAQHFIINQSDLSDDVASICGILVPRISTGHASPPCELTYVPTEKSVKALRQLADSIRKSEPVMLIGKAGSGKTFLINELTKYLRCQNSVVKIHLGEQTDAKLLIGTYTSGEKPGTFVWRSGVLTTAVQEGRCVLIEDVDKAPTEVLSILLTLLESRQLSVPSRGETIRAANGFQLISTVRLNEETAKKKGNTIDHLNVLGMRLWRTIFLEEPNESDLSRILSHKFPLLLHLLPKLIQAYNSVKEIYQNPQFTSFNKGSHARIVSVRDLVKLCNRIQQLLANNNVISADQLIESQIYDDIFAEAADCFAGAIGESRALEPLIKSIGQCLDISTSRIGLYFKNHIPKFEVNQDHILIGRSILPRSNLSLQKKSVNSTSFATTNHSLRLMEQIAVSIQLCEPVLLVGETGTGKTTIVQQLGKLLHKPLTVINVSQQTETGDLLGGYKPVNSKTVALPIQETFESLFAATFSIKKNEHFYKMLHRCFNKNQWRNVVRLWNEACKMAGNILREKVEPKDEDSKKKKKRRLNSHEKELLREKWIQFQDRVQKFEIQATSMENSFVFDYVEGSLVKAVRNGEWLLLDEINLASADTLESISDLLAEEQSRSILLSEKGEADPVRAHPDFRIFACMNPATDVGKKDLPTGIRSRFTEIYVHSPDRDISDLLTIIDKYIHKYSVSDEWVGNDIAELYLEAKKLADGHKIVDGSNEKPHFSIRTLTRTLLYVCDIVHIYGLRRSLYDGFCMSFLTLLSQASEAVLEPIVRKYTLGRLKNIKSVISQAPPAPGPDYVQFKHYWMKKGAEEVKEQAHYIITPFVEKNLMNLVRASSSKRFPVLVQGPTSAGKTSMIKYLADLTGHKFVRINNHEHTDLQEYLGTYVADDTGKLTFKEGVLVEALRNGYWIVLDELNLAPTDVLEALNRLLDDNRELFIPETQQIVHPHPDFMLFATQNPPGVYGGRKVLSRAFRNRFLELHFDDIPEDELEIILRERCQIAPSYAKKIVETYRQLSIERSSSRLFEQKNSFATLRDLFRWALRDAVGYEQLASNGYMLLAERCRTRQEKEVVQKTLEKVMKVNLDMDSFYRGLEDASLFSQESPVVWTKAMRRLAVLVSACLQNNEPVLLVGETGCGKTTICQILASLRGKNLIMLNAHQNTETGDLLGAQRPVRNRAAIQIRLSEILRQVLTVSEEVPGDEVDELLQQYGKMDKSNIEKSQQDVIQQLRENLKTLFEWCDGPLVQAMKTGDFFLLDEISLADDSVLERLNSVLEPERTLLLAEKGASDSLIFASDGFQFLATMNPGGDYGKKELSPALRNRFTEIWVSSMEDFDDVKLIVSSKLAAPLIYLGEVIVQFSKWFALKFGGGSATNGIISLRDIIAWVNFMNISASTVDDHFVVLAHGAAMVFIDALGTNNTAYLAENETNLAELKMECVQILSKFTQKDLSVYFAETTFIEVCGKSIRIGPFTLERNHEQCITSSFNWNAPTTAMNILRVTRALQVRKPILLEGSPGVGKTSLVTALAAMTGNLLTRINLSEQTDLIDLFGSDVPGENAGEFVWRDAPFLRAMQLGEWVLLDEMNLASQSVLEGLNACLDHRGEAYIPELDKTFIRHPNFTVFAAQNPQYQGGGRKGLPKSFVNRFSVVYINTLSSDDLLLIAERLFPNVDSKISAKMIELMSTLEDQVCKRKLWGTHGAPWEFNLRDTLRWMSLLNGSYLLETVKVVDFFDMIVGQRFRNETDRQRARNLIEQFFGCFETRENVCRLNLDYLEVNSEIIKRNYSYRFPTLTKVFPLQCNFAIYESALRCIKNSWPVILVGPTNAGKTNIINFLASSVGAQVTTFSMNGDIDSMDILGGYEQVDLTRKISAITSDLRGVLRDFLVTGMGIELQDGLTMNAALALLKLISENVITAETFSVFYDRFTSFLPHIKNIPGIQDLSYRIRHMCELVDAPKTVKFEWFDGALVRAVEEGHWLVLDNANLCSPSVLDRLNSLLETNGSLVINECSESDGQPRTVIPNSNFRLFLTVNPKYGELSRAMRNRGVEIFVGDLKERASSFDRAILGFEPDQVSDVDLPVDQHLTGLSLSDTKCWLPLKRFVPAHLSSASLFAEIHDVISKSANQCTEDAILSIIPMERLKEIKPWVENLRRNRFFSEAPMAEKISVYNEFLLSLDVNQRMLYLLKPVQERIAHLLQLPLENCCSQTLLPTVNVYELPTVIKSCKKNIESESIYLMASLKILLECIHHLEYTNTKSVGGKLNELSYIEMSAAVANGRNIKFPPQIPIYLVLKESAEFFLRSFSQGNLFDQSDFYLFTWRFLIIWIGAFSASYRKDEARLAVYKELFQKCIEAGLKQTSAGNDLLDIFSIFNDSLRLSRGNSINILWSSFRKNYPSNAIYWTYWNDLLRISRKFDEIAKLQFSEAYEEVESLRDIFTRVFADVLESNADNFELLASNLTSGIQRLEEISASFLIKRQHYFSIEFDHIARCLLAEDKEKWEAINQLAPSTTLSTEQIYKIRSKAYCYPSVFDFLWIKNDGSYRSHTTSLFSTAFFRDIIMKCNTMKTFPGSLLKQTLSDARLLLASAAKFSRSILNDPLRTFADKLHMWLGRVIEAHVDVTITGLEEEEVFKIVLEKGNDTFVSQFQQYLQPVIRLLKEARSHEDYGRAWVYFGSALITIYAPDHPSDPALHDYVLYDNYQKNMAFCEQLKRSWAAVREVASGDRALLIEKLLRSTTGEDAPKKPRVYRPPSAIDDLFEEWTALYNSTVSVANAENLMQSIESWNTTSLNRVAMFQQNTSQFLDRLEGGYQYFSDLNDIFAGYVYCMKFGFDLLVYGKERSLVTTETSTMWAIDPLTILSSSKIDATFSDVVNFCKTCSADVTSVDKILAFYLQLSGFHKLDTKLSETWNGVLRILYYRWSLRERKAESKSKEQSSIFRYQDNAENFEEDFKKLFPDYEDVMTVNTIDDSSADIELASIYHSIAKSYIDFFEQGNADSIDSMVQKGSEVMQMLWEVGMRLKEHSSEGAHLTAVLNRLTGEIKSFESGSNATQFYGKYSTAESQKAVTITDALWKSVVNLLAQWPEHATLKELSRICKEFMDYPINTPIARQLQKLEQIYTFVTEWEKYASSQVSLKAHMKNITDLIISWRRLELETWAGLLDAEDSKLELNIGKWWFHLLEIIIIPDESELDDSKLLSVATALNVYFSTSPIGEFSIRLKLLKAFSKHVDLERPESKIAHAVHNVIAFYSQFEPIVTDRIASGRKEVQKDIKEVILLASWKDINIEALKQSSRRSHSSLYKLVRRYRALVSEQVQPVIDNGIPTTLKLPNRTQSIEHLKTSELDLDEAKKLVLNVPGWSTRSEPLKRVDVVSKNMDNYLKQISEMEVPTFTSLAKRFSAEAERLEKETPKVYSKEKKKLLASLKMQKNKALSDCLKELKRIGLKSSFRKDIHTVQSSTTAILTNMVSFSTPLLKNSDSYFLRILEILPGLRRAVAEPSESIPRIYLERGMANMENLIFSLITTRSPIQKLATSYDKIESLRLDLENVARCRKNVNFQAMKFHHDNLHTICQWLPLLIDYAISTLHVTPEFGDVSKDVIFLQKVKDNLIEFKQSATAITAWDTGSQEIYENFEKFLNKLLTDLQAQKNDRTFYIYDMIIEWLEESGHINMQAGCKDGSLTSIEAALRKVFASILMSVQKILDNGVQSVDEDEDKWFSTSTASIVGSIKASHHSAVLRNVENAVLLLKNYEYVTQNSVLARALVSFTLPVVRSYQRALALLLQKARSFYQDMAHGSYIFSVLLRSLAQNGFCSPEPPSEEVDDNNLHDGTGLGDGEGAQNNSKDVEQDDDLTENAQEKNEENDSQDKDDQDDDAVEMEGDMAGDLENVSEQDEEHEANEENEQDELDEEIDNLDDDDPNAIDDKMWDDKPDENAKERNTDNNVAGQDEADVQAAENENQNQNAGDGETEGQEENEEKSKESEDIKEEEDNELEENSEEEDQVGEQQDEVRNEVGEDLSPQVPETETLDLPEDIDLGSDGDKDEEEVSDEEMGDLGETEDQMKEDESAVEDDSRDQDVDMDDSVTEETDQLDDDQEMDDASPEGSDHKSDAEGDDADRSDEETLQQDDENLDRDGGEGAAKDVDEGLGGVKESTETEANDAEATAQDISGSKGIGSDKRETEETADIGNSGAAHEIDQEHQPDQKENNESSKNEAKEALKQLGDSLKEYHKRRQEINEASQTDENEQTKESANQRPDEFEHLDGANTESETQALGQANQDQIRSMNEENAIEDDISDLEDEEKPDIDMGAEEDLVNDESEENKPLDMNNSKEQVTKGAFIGQAKERSDADRSLADSLQMNNIDELEDFISEVDAETSEEVTVPPRSIEESRELWHQSEISTAELSARLSEQLRLILEPTLATKLKGDYKTGKRLNMKRIIPYIASQFKKDKIWLRRTKPSKRQYQIMVALDDSKSMSESKCVKLAFDSLCLVSKTLTQLESGGLSIIKFGESVKEVHSFDQQFSNDAGAKTFQWFGFQEKKTDIKKLVAESIKIFERARPMNTGDQWQLQIVISDGLCEDHETVQRLVRRARENRIMLVFVIIDGISNNESIMDMSQVKYVPDQHGNLQLKIDKYLDTFPFEFYVVVHDIYELPEMLSTILRQFFQDLASS
ncbi:hypothetical protein HG537_0H01600 [Torulaspora globosa]|uniref:Midasin n=1 Tax=Torulaspora globosa TaxID=48254 RepID=A0A7H9HXE1_9SACH|nr:hypothetical protein HG537_0H01600 [Torulaspora sp. CBS 2947]